MLRNIKEIKMKNISVHIKKEEKTTFTFKKPIATYGTRIAAKEVTVFWNFRNITSTIGNHTFTITNASPPEKTINSSAVNLKKLGSLLGFAENHQLAGKTSEASSNAVDVNHGLRWLTVTCDLIDMSKNIDLDGEESNILAFLPITPGTRLNSNCYVYERENAWRAAKNAIVSEMVFTVNSNITEKVDVDILLDLALE